MLDINQLLIEYVDSKEKKERQIGRYYSSELWEILNNRKKPEEFFKQKEYDLRAARNIIEGNLREEILAKIFETGELDVIHHSKKELEVEDFVIVCEVDFEFPEFILEIKTPEKMEKQIKYYHPPQLEAQYRAFKKPIWVGYFKERFEKRYFKYAPDDTLWENIIEKTRTFHKEVQKVHNERAQTKS